MVRVAVIRQSYKILFDEQNQAPFAYSIFIRKGSIRRQGMGMVKYVQIIPKLHTMLNLKIPACSCHLNEHESPALSSNSLNDVPMTSEGKTGLFP